MMEQVGKGLGKGGLANLSGAARVWRPMLEMVRLHLRLHPGHVQARQLLVQAKVALEQTVAVTDGEYELVRQLAEILDQDIMAVAGGRGGAPAARDPIAALVQAGRLGSEATRAAREILQVAEAMRDGGVAGLRAMDTTAIRVDGGCATGDMMTRTSRHPALALVGEWVRELDAAGRVWPDQRGRWRQHSEVVLSVIVDRQGCRDLERSLCVRNGAVSRAVADALDAYAAGAAAAWARSDRNLAMLAKERGDSY